KLYGEMLNAKKGTFTRITSAQEIIKEFMSALPNHWKFKLLWIMHIAGLLLTLFAEHGVEPTQLFILTSSNNELNKILISIIKTNTYNSFSTCSLNSSKKEIMKELDETNDGVALFRDVTNFDDEDSTINAIKYIRNDLLHANGIEDYARHLTVILTSWVSSQIPSDEMFLLSFDDVQMPLNCNAEKLQELSQEFDSILILFVTSHFKELKERFKTFIFTNRSELVDNLPENRADMFMIFLMACGILKNDFGINLFNNDEFIQVSDLFRKEEEYEDRSFAIVQEFVSVANELIRNGQLQMLDKKHSETIQNIENTLIVTDNSLAFSPESIDKIILPRMETTKHRRMLIKALEDCECLYGTARKKQPFNRKNAKGEIFRFRPYGIDRNIFADDVRQKMDSLSMGEFFCDKNEIPKGHFLPLIYSNGRIAGKQIKPLSNENNIIYVTGISGIGKSYALAQIATFLSDLHHRIVIFDSKGSFSDEALKENLPLNFVENHVTIHDLDSKIIPINLFDIDSDISETDNAEKIANMLFAPVTVSAPTQLNTLTMLLVDLINDAEFRKNSAGKLLTVLKNKKPELLKWIGVALTDMKDCEMMEQNWQEFIRPLAK
ncbi:MAG: hypothetical protein K2H66_01865, partial [Oscillospiraceae bacterium]|nr:hypothetical protein [Oscillospiraceae bacterium]